MSTMPELPKTNEGKRICQVIKVKPEALEEYKKCHAAVWPEVLEALRKAHVVDYSIHFLEQEHLLIAHMRYIGDDYEGDMAQIGKSEATQKWWKSKVPGYLPNWITRARTHANGQMTDGMQESYVPGATGSASGPGWWTDCEEVFRMEG